MRKFIQSKLALTVAAGLFAGYFVVGALAAPGATPWPDPLNSGGGAVVQQDEEVDETPELDETPEADETPDVDETPEADETPDAAETPELDVEVEEATPGVPLDSPACAGTVEDSNPHDTDGDGDGCREVDGKNLPDPAADAQQGNPGIIGEQHGHGHPTATPTPTP